MNNVLPHLRELALGGTAVGTGLNTSAGYDIEIAKMVRTYTYRSSDRCILGNAH